MVPYPITPKVSSHRLSIAEGWAIAWMLEITAARSRVAGHHAAADEFEDGAAAFRMAVSMSRPSLVDMSETTIENLTTIAWNLLDEQADDPVTMERLALLEWAHISEELLMMDESGGAFTRFLAECSGPAAFPAYAASVIAGLREHAGIELDLRN